MSKSCREIVNIPISVIECLLYLKEKKVTLGAFIVIPFRPSKHFKVRIFILICFSDKETKPKRVL